MKNNTVKEVWKGIEGYESIYMISNLGNVWSHRTNNILNPYISKEGYKCIGLRKDGKESRKKSEYSVRKEKRR
ncbi:hypothetical protein ER45_029665 (plasmid) [Bacillus mycoides]|nr:hypothetical protein ER45_029665 [Bacillus mycoides]